VDVKFQLFPDRASTMAPRVDAVFWFVTAVAAFFIVLIAVLLFYFAIRYRRRREDYYPKPIVGSTVLETAWTVGPLLLALVMFAWGASIYFDITRTPENALEVYVTGRQWMWHLQHVDGQREINMLHVPAGRPVKLIMTSEDVLHDFFIPAFRVKMDVIPGRYTYLWFEATQPGTYPLYCALYCGTDHSRMIGSVVVMEPTEYARWRAGNKADLSLALQGRQLFQKLQCVTCHYAAAGSRAPLLEGLFNRDVSVRLGADPNARVVDVRANEAYLRESILQPRAKVRQGYQPIMPAYALKDPQTGKGDVSEGDLFRLIAFLKELGPGQTPPRVEESAPPAVEVKPEEKKDKSSKK
jgi:cytochrome c oxidase subunit 2